MIDSLSVAIMFHETYERLAPSFGYETRKDTKEFDPNSPNGKLMVAVCREVGEKISLSSFQSGFQAGLLENNKEATHV